MEYYDEIFDLKPIFPEIHSNGRSINSDNNNNSSSNSTAAAPKLLSFESSNSPQMDQSSLNVDYSVTSEIINFSSSTKDDYSSNNEYYPQKRINSCAAARTPSQAMDHVVAERKRRENLSQLFISLSKVVPGLKKLDKASLLEDGINYVKAMQERVRVLEEEEERRNAAVKEDSSSSYSGGESEGPEIHARISDKHVLIKMFCKNKMGLMSRIPSEMMDIMHLNVVDMRIMPFGGTALDITILAEVF
ncbi:transcription factor bHLH25-like isoform X2 [Salvia miltiorrhiza]|uniref:transcription factor bHLH25-like isoform X2 n=1 Tax=Salvia miltiorrhiza TaxID=226208 RepID=UPI0025ACB696|nr:transcription factor bHLH25-like isoform X2 [Salvia miltiorrhiza]XP_057793734.1 transcription factor bHLH25-like isoform X2 [Salvia miltiorrhiza]